MSTNPPPLRPPKRVQVQVDDADHRRLKMHAAQRGVTQNDWIRAAIDKQLQADGQKPLKPL